MKYIISLLLGLLGGAGIFVAGLYFNPFAGGPTLSPLAISDTELQSLYYSAAAAESIMFTNDGESISKPHPDRVAELWEPTIQDTNVLVTTLMDVRGDAVGIGIKITTPSERTRLFNSLVLVDSVWHLYVPGKGVLVIEQTENYWDYLRDIVFPAWSSSGDSWRGNWIRNMTAGPGALGTAKVTGLSGEFGGQSGEAVESLQARAYSILEGPVSMTGTLSFVMDTSLESTD